jgi:hypothetical protein
VVEEEQVRRRLVRSVKLLEHGITGTELVVYCIVGSYQKVVNFVILKLSILAS